MAPAIDSVDRELPSRLKLVQGNNMVDPDDPAGVTIL
jgi:hypothetical protein